MRFKKKTELIQKMNGQGKRCLVFLRTDRYMTTGWKQVEGKWYYLATDGGMQTNWVWTGENWYFMNADGSMATGWVLVNDSWYYLNQSGECLLNTVTPDGYRVNEKGAWTK